MHPYLGLRALRFYFQLSKSLRKCLASLRAGDVVLDIGANVGVVSWLFLWKQCYVVAVEPHPVAFQKLKRAFEFNPNIELINAAVSTEKKEYVKLYLHIQDYTNTSKFSLGSSLRADKPNVGQAFVEVRNLDILEIVKRFQNVKIIKVDIEGYEVELIPYIFGSEEISIIDNIFVELHDKKWSGIREETRMLTQNKFIKNAKTKVFWDWP